MTKLLFSTLPLLLALTIRCVAMTDSTHVRILFDEYTEPKNVHIELDNSRGPIESNIRFEGGTFIASAISEVPYIGVIIRYSAGEKRICTHRFWAGKGQSEIRFPAQSTPSTSCPLNDFKLTNAIDVQYHDQKLAEFTSRETAVLDSISSLLRARMEGGDTLAHRTEEIFNSIGSAKKKIFDRQLRYFQDYPDEYSFAKFSEIILDSEGTFEPDVMQVFEAFPQRFRQSPQGGEVLRTIQGKFQREGSVALDYTTVDIHGTPLKLADYKGKHVLMVFWATWCGPCVEEIPTIKSLHDTYKDSEKLVIISIAKDDILDKVKDYITTKNMNWLHVVNDNRLIREYGVWGVPRTILIDPLGKIAIIENGKEISRLVNYLDKAMAKR
jgi:thiol-disulfide isomerase/thioredoxin